MAAVWYIMIWMRGFCKNRACEIARMRMSIDGKLEKYKEYERKDSRLQ